MSERGAARGESREEPGADALRLHFDEDSGNDALDLAGGRDSNLSLGDVLFGAPENDAAPPAEPDEQRPVRERSGAAASMRGADDGLNGLNDRERAAMRELEAHAADAPSQRASEREPTKPRAAGRIDSANFFAPDQTEEEQAAARELIFSRGQKWAREQATRDRAPAETTSPRANDNADARAARVEAQSPRGPKPQPHHAHARLVEERAARTKGDPRRDPTLPHDVPVPVQQSAGRGRHAEEIIRPREPRPANVNDPRRTAVQRGGAIVAREDGPAASQPQAARARAGQVTADGPASSTPRAPQRKGSSDSNARVGASSRVPSDSNARLAAQRAAQGKASGDSSGKLEAQRAAQRKAPGDSSAGTAAQRKSADSSGRVAAQREAARVARETAETQPPDPPRTRSQLGAEGADPRKTIPEGRRLAHQVRSNSPDPRLAAPQSRTNSLDPRAASPQSRANSLDPRAASPQSRANSLDPRAASPQSRVSSPEPRAASPRAGESFSERTPAPDARKPAARSDDPRATIPEGRRLPYQPDASNTPAAAIPGRKFPSQGGAQSSTSYSQRSGEAQSTRVPISRAPANPNARRSQRAAAESSASARPAGNPAAGSPAASNRAASSGRHGAVNAASSNRAAANSRGASPKPAAAVSGRSPRSSTPSSDLPLLYCEIDGLAVEIQSQDLTPAGLFVQTPSPPAADSEVSVFLRVGPREIEAAGHVVQSVPLDLARRERRRPGFGLLFTSIDEATRAALRGALEALNAQPQFDEDDYDFSRPPTNPHLDLEAGRREATARAAAASGSAATDSSRARSNEGAPAKARSNEPAAAKPRSNEPAAAKPRSNEPAAAKPQPSAADPSERELLAKLQAELVQVQSQPPWTVLGISQGADEATARKAFHDASKRYHPHSFARYSMPEIKAVVTQIFIVYKRAFTTMTKTGRGGRNAKPAAGSGNPPQRSSDPGTR